MSSRIIEKKSDDPALANARQHYTAIISNQQKFGRMGSKRAGYRFQDGGDNLRNLMRGFGDDLEPRHDTSELMEQYLIEFLSNMCNRTLQRSLRGGHNSMQLGDLIHFMSTDPKKYYRIPFILEISKHINAKKM